jgi:hypothetical protein
MAFNFAGGSAANLKIPAKLVAAGDVGDTVMIDLTNAAARDGYYAIKPQTDLPEEAFTVKGVILGPVGHSFLADAEVLIGVFGYFPTVAVETTQDIDIGDLLIPVDNADYLVTTAVQPALTAITDSSGGTASTTIAAIGATYDQDQVRNAVASLALAVNSILVHMKAVGVALEARDDNDEGTIKAFIKSL